MKKKRTSIVLLSVFGALFLSTMVLAILIFANIIATGYNALGTPFIVFSLFAFAISMILSQLLFLRHKERKELLEDNLYVFGKTTLFYNQHIFFNNVRARREKRSFRKKTQTVVIFSFAPIAISSNPDHNEGISELNYEIARYLETFFGLQKKSRGVYGDTIYCYYRGTFGLYLFCPEEKVLPLLEEISKKLYELGANNRVKVLIQPFFGIYHPSVEDSLQMIVENASLSRNNAEATFEMYSYFDPSFKIASSLSEIQEIEEAIKNDEMVVYYQPKYSLRERRFISAEALVRWNSPKYGLLSPGSFIEKAENAGLISEIDRHVFELTLRDLKEAIEKGHRVMPVSVNFSLYEFFSPNFLDFIVDLLEKYRIPPTLIEVEITETTSQANQFMSIQIIKKLKDKGVRVLMDDFGIGYSGIDNLRKIPFDAIKIDKSFTDLINDDEKTRGIINFIVELGHMNDIEVIIEGVDNEKQVEFLKKIKMDTIQGFYYSRPIPFAQYEAFLKDNPYEKGGKRK